MSKEKYLADVEWLLIDSTNEYKSLKEDLLTVIEDLYESASIKELVINDILQTFRIHGFEVIQTNPEKIRNTIYD
jgi:hypothetical protein